MRILLGHNSTYFPSQGGGDKSNRLLMEALAARGHRVRVVTRVERFGAEGRAAFDAAMAARGIAHTDGRFSLNSVDVHTLTLDPNIRAYFLRQIAEFDPDAIVLSTDDPAQLLLEPVLESVRAKVIYLVRATIALPFGPDASSVSPARANRLRQVDRIVGVSEYVARYVREYLGAEAIHVPISLMEPGLPPAVGRWDNPYVAMVNPCAVKGLSIFLEVAYRLPGLRFAAVPSWGTGEGDLAELRARPNMTLLPRADDIVDILRSTRILMVPSVWAEARARMVLEAMAHGVPVIAADIGGLAEAKMGVPYLLPVNPVTRYLPAVDEKMVPVPEVPPQDAAPWIAAVDRLAADPEHYAEISRESRAAGLNYMANLTAGPFEALLRETPRRVRALAPAAPISPDRQKLLTLRLKQNMQQKLWFPSCKSRTFCFPFAGAGVMWARKLNVCAALLPGRELRIDEPPILRMEELIPALIEAISPLLDSPYNFFGHSMGAGIAYELAQALREKGRRQPSALILSASKGPRLREYLPELTDAELIEELIPLGGIPVGAAADADWMRFLFPALRADARLYRRYVPPARTPLDIPIFAYAGATDPRVTPEEVEAWKWETTGKFRLRVFPGGHFYFQDDPAKLLSAMEEDKGSL